MATLGDCRTLADFSPQVEALSENQAQPYG
jgi:hypothetical protein